uniref:Poly(A) binding protein interacting protein 2 n=1 Tax=Callithrix jacchus TaxID=9483 RepID=A0A8I3WW02_CALJA
MKDPSRSSTSPSIINKDVIMNGHSHEDDNPFAEYMWMENEEEFNRQIEEELWEEEFIERCFQEMLEEEEEFIEPCTNTKNKNVFFVYDFKNNSYLIDWTGKMWHIYTMEYYAAIKNDEFMSFVGTWMNLENIILSKLTQEQKMKCRMFSLRGG